MIHIGRKIRLILPKKSKSKHKQTTRDAKQRS